MIHFTDLQVSLMNGQHVIYSVTRRDNNILLFVTEIVNIPAVSENKNVLLKSRCLTVMVLFTSGVFYKAPADTTCCLPFSACVSWCVQVSTKFRLL